MLPALGLLATQQTNPMQHTLAIVCQQLDYAATHPDAMTPTVPVTWFLPPTAMPRTSQNPKHAVTQAGIFSFLKMMFFLQTMVPS